MTKTCSKCKEEKSLECFYVNRKKGGWCSYCKECDNARKRSYNKKHYSKEYNSKKCKKWYWENREKQLKSMREWKKKNKRKEKYRPPKTKEERLKKACRRRTYHAIETGKLIKQPCKSNGDDCEGRIEAHHTDYNDHMDVLWLCRYHHGEWHSLNEPAPPKIT